MKRVTFLGRPFACFFLYLEYFLHLELCAEDIEISLVQESALVLILAL